MKRFFCLLTVLLLSRTLCSAEYAWPRYTLSGNGEAIVDDVDFAFAGEADDACRVFYEIFVGSFSDSDGDGVGDLRGIINRMDYLNDGDPESGLSLGVEGIWLTPVFRSPTYHKYDVEDYRSVDPAFGSEADLTELIGLCHERDVKVILDLPVNHTGRQHRWFRNFVNAHRCHDPANPWYDFYTWIPENEKWPAGRHFARVPGADFLYEANFDDSMPELNFDNPAVRSAVLDEARYWLERGVDGFRFDAAKYIYYGDDVKSAEFWQWYTGELKKTRPGLYTVAEVWDGEGIIERYLPCTNCFNFSASQAEGLIARTARGGDAGKFTAYVQRYSERVRECNPDGVCVLFVSNHDMDRAAGYLTAAGGHMKVAANLYLLSPGSPFIYYGEEIGLRGSRGGARTDANRRLAMLWGDGDTVQDPPGADYTKQTPYPVSSLKGMSDSLYNYYKKLIMIRKANPEIACGTYRALTLPGTGLGGFCAERNGRRVAVIHNTKPAVRRLELTNVPELAGVKTVIPVGMGTAYLEGTVLVVEGQTSVVMR